MDSERFRQVRRIFDESVERSAETRSEFLRGACSGDDALLHEVARLLAAYGEPTAGPYIAEPDKVEGRLEGRRIGPYAVLRQVGEGGMGEVYLAARADGTFQKSVALKVVRPGAATGEVLRRFQQEREILAALDHPNIARIFDGGVTDDGLPYFVMEFVEGEPIDKYCDNRRLDITERLNLFRNVCSAVEYAHRKQVIHRDLKPNNILVDGSGVVKLLDFGIAKLQQPATGDQTLLTRSDMRLMTPEYASPEQVSGESITPASDVYGLGVVLYELLTGHRPYHLRSRILQEVLRVICEEPPTRPSSVVTRNVRPDSPLSPEMVGRSRAVSAADLKRRLSGDLDAILLKALEKAPAYRYASARRFEDDLRMHLEGARIEARPQSLFEPLLRFGGKNPSLLIGGSALAIALATGMIAFSADAVRLALIVLGGGATSLAFVLLVRVVFPGLRWKPDVADDQFRLATRLFIVGFLIFFVWYRLTGASGVALIVYLLPAGAFIAQTVGLIRFRLRERIFGGLLLELTDKRDKGMLVMAILVFVMCTLILVIFTAIRFRPDPVPLWANLSVAFFWLYSVSFLLYVYFLYDVYEIRVKGILFRGKTYIPWKEVTSHFWEVRRGTVEGLRIRIRSPRILSWVPPIYIPVRPENRERVSAILEKQLAEWPGEI